MRACKMYTFGLDSMNKPFLALYFWTILAFVHTL